ncbi:MAG TPA: ATP-binding protein [Clostridia bacterium]|nr:ATP-binding protein [Clostridia bacterium]
MTNRFNERTWLEWLVKVRVLIITFLLAIEVAITTLTPTNVDQNLFVGIIFVWYAAAAAHIVSLRFWQGTQRQSEVQVIADLVMATAVIYATGGIDTSFNFLYPLIIIIASVLLSRGWAYYTAAVSFVLLGGVLELSYFGLIHSYSVTHPDLKSLQAVIFINGFAYATIAYLATRLSNRLRQVDVELADKTFALEDLKALHENIVNSISGGLITTDLQGRVKVINFSGQILLGVKECAGRHVQELFSDPLPDPKSPSGTKEVRVRTGSGAEKLFRITLTPLLVPERGEIGYVYVFDDLTEIRRLEREIRMRDRLAAIGRLAAGIAHEIRNPLSSIAGSVKFLANISALTDDQRALVGIVNRESERLNAIITDFLTYSREKKLSMEPVDLRMLLEDTLTLLSNRSCGITVERRFGAKEAFALGDGDRLKQVFWNLCENAVRAMEPAQGGEPKGKLSVALESDGDLWTIRFRDTGAGMTQQQIEKIFEPFQTAFEGGTGLGLAIVYQIVHAHGAHISVSSTPGTGTEFAVSFRKTARPKPLAAEASAQLRS